MRIYLDTCALKRPFDRQAEDRVTLEALAVVSIVEAFEQGRIAVLSSSVLETENARNPDEERRASIDHLLRGPVNRIAVAPEIANRAREFFARGLRPLDALHLAAAEAGQADFLVTTDDQFLRASARLGATLRVRVVGPLVAAAAIPGRGPS